MHTGRFVGIAGAAGMLGGLLWIMGTAMHASRPVGCVAEECASRAMRDSSLLEGVLGIGALVLMAVAAVALIVLTHRAGRFGKLGGAAAFLVVASAMRRREGRNLTRARGPFRPSNLHAASDVPWQVR